MTALDILLLAITFLGSYILLVGILYVSAKVIFPFDDQKDFQHEGTTQTIKLNNSVSKRISKKRMITTTV